MAIIFSCKCGKRYQVADEYAGKQTKCPACGQVVQIPSASPAAAPAPVPQAPRPVAAAPPPPAAPPLPAAPPVAWQVAPPAAGPVGHTLTSFSPGLAILLHFLTCGVFSAIWLNLLHGKMPKNRPDDPSAGKAIGFLFIPFYNLYWVFFTYCRLVTRINEQRRLRGLPDKAPRGLAIAMCVVMIIPYVGVVSWAILAPIFLGTVQSAVNELVTVTAGQPRPPGA